MAVSCLCAHVLALWVKDICKNQLMLVKTTWFAVQHFKKYACMYIIGCLTR